MACSFLKVRQYSIPIAYAVIPVTVSETKKYQLCLSERMLSHPFGIIHSDTAINLDQSNRRCCQGVLSEINNALSEGQNCEYFRGPSGIYEYADEMRCSQGPQNNSSYLPKAIHMNDACPMHTNYRSMHCSQATHSKRLIYPFDSSISTHI